MKKNETIKTAFLYRYRQFSSSRFIPALTLISILLVLTCAVFVIGYIFGLSYSSNSSPTQAPSHAVKFSINFKITPYPPNESSWHTYTCIAHYHTYTLTLPPNFLQQPSSTTGICLFSDQTGNTISGSTASSYTKITKPDYLVHTFGMFYQQQIKQGTEIDKAIFDLLNENIIISYRGISPQEYHFITIPAQVSVITYVIPRTDVTNTIHTISSDVASISYQGQYYIDQVDLNTLNCQNIQESIIHFIQSGYTIIVEIHPCQNTKTYAILHAQEVILGNQKYIQITYPNERICYLNTNTPAIRYLLFYPLTKWQFAPQQSVEKNNIYSLFCIQSVNGKALDSETLTQATSDLQFIIQNISYLE